MIVVLDTNVIISALLSPSGPPAEIIHRWEASEFDVAVSSALVAELEEALAYPHVARYHKLSKKSRDSRPHRFACLRTGHDQIAGPGVARRRSRLMRPR